MILSILSFLPALAIGLLVMLLAWPGRYQDDLPLKICLAVGIGPGITSCLYFAFSLFLRPRSRIYFILEGLVLAGLLVLLFVLRKKKTISAADRSVVIPHSNWISTLLVTALVAALVVSAASFAIQSLMQPHGIQDAWNIWNMRARFLFRGGPDWKLLFSPAIYWLNHPDYPFLVSAGTARGWNIAGSETTRVPILQAALYSFGLVGLVFTALSRQRSPGQGALAAMLLVASPWFVLFGAWQIADIPLDFFISAALFMLILIVSAPPPANPGQVFVLGLTGGLAAWTKNEGILFLVILLGVWLLARLVARTSWTRLRKETGPLLLGLALPLLVLIYLKLILAPASDLFAGQTSSTITSQIMDISRYSLTISYLGKSVIHFSQWSVPLLPLLAIFTFLFWPVKDPGRRILIYPALAILLLGCGYFAIYIITPHDLVWHLRTSTDRLVFHLFPPLLLVIFSATRSPEDIIHSLRDRKSPTPTG